MSCSTLILCVCSVVSGKYLCTSVLVNGFFAETLKSFMCEVLVRALTYPGSCGWTC